MGEAVTAIYENGVLRLLEPLALPEHTQVQVYIQTAALHMDEHHRQVYEALVRAGLSSPEPDPVPPGEPLSEEEREELARRFAVGKPLSEIIIEERDGR